MENNVKVYKVEVYPCGTQYWYLNGQLHREDGPAVIYADGTQYWWLNGQLHREDGPAIIYADGTQEWCLNDQLHREDGPAIVYGDGSGLWYLYGDNITEQEHRQRTITNPVKELSVAEIEELLGYKVKIVKG